jgi:ribosomal protein S18 acetylase RimI-like enzyme
MKPEDRVAAAALLASLIQGDGIAEHSAAYGGAGDDAAIERAFKLFLDRPDLGFIWLTLRESKPVALVTVCFVVSTNLGGLVAKIPDFVVSTDARRQGIGRLTMASLVEELRPLGVGRIDLGVHDNNSKARAFYDSLGFISNHEVGMSLVL